MRSESGSRTSQGRGLSTGWAIFVSPRRLQYASVLRVRLVRAKSVVTFGALVYEPTSHGKRAQSPILPQTHSSTLWECVPHRTSFETWSKCLTGQF